MPAAPAGIVLPKPESAADAIERRLDEVEVVLVSDYDKGVCGEEFMTRMVELCRRKGVPVIADPKRAAVERVGARIAAALEGETGAKVIPLREGAE